MRARAGAALCLAGLLLAPPPAHPAAGALPAGAGEAAPAGMAATPEGTAPDTLPRSTVGLALSGGGARGFAHVGVLEVLAELGVPVDVVAGTSMGAVVGAMHAIGYDARELRTLAVERNWDALFSETEREPSLWPWTPAEAERHVVGLPLRSGRPTLPTGLVTGQRVTLLLARLTWRVHPVEDFSRLPVPFVAVATDLETGEAVPLEGGFLPRALRASLAVPSIFTPVTIGDRLLVDGGASRNLPAEDARRLGADVLVCSDVTEPLEPADSIRTFLDVLNQTISFQTTRAAAEQRELCDVVIRPGPDGPGTYAFGEAAEWIRRGAEAARERADTLRALARAARREEAGDAGAGDREAAPDQRDPGLARDRGADPASLPARLDPAARPDSVFLTSVRFPGFPPDRARYLRRRLGLEAPGPTSLARIDREVGRLYDAGLFARVFYRLELPGPPGGAGPDTLDVPGAALPSARRPWATPVVTGSDLPRRVLQVVTSPERRRELRIGGRFDSHRQAAALLTVELPRTPGFGGSARVDVRLGEQLHFEARQTLRPTFAPGLLLGARAGFRRTPLELRDPPGPGRTELDVAAEALGPGLFAGTVLGRHGVVGLQAGGEWFETDFEDAGPRPDRNGWLTTAGALLTWDSRDRVTFPRSGWKLEVEVETSDDLPGSDREMTQAWGDLAVHVPLRERWSLRARISAGSTAGETPPLHRAFFLGGAVPDFVAPRRRLTLPGIAPERLRGEKLQRAELGLQLRPRPDLHLSVGWTGGDALDEWTVRPSEWTHGVHLSAGISTALGPVRVTVADATASGGPRIALDAGGRF